jgi:hypothetical protein
MKNLREINESLEVSYWHLSGIPYHTILQKVRGFVGGLTGLGEEMTTTTTEKTFIRIRRQGKNCMNLAIESWKSNGNSVRSKCLLTLPSPPVGGRG